MDWISLLKAQQADFLQRVKKTKIIDLSLLESQVKGCHSETMAFWGDTLAKLLEIARQQAEIIGLNPPPIPPEYPTPPDWTIPFPKHFQQQAQDYFLREQIVDRLLGERLGKLVKKISQDTLQNMALDDEGNLARESKFSYYLTDNPRISVQVHVADGESFNRLKKNQIRWLVTQKDLKNNHVLIFVCLLSPFHRKKNYDKQAVITGFLPTNQIELRERKLDITPSELLYSGGLSWYLESLTAKPDPQSISDKIVIAQTSQTLPQNHPPKSVIGDWECWQTLEGHTKGINCLAFSPGIKKDANKPLLASGSRGETKLWDLSKGELIGTLSESPWSLSGLVNEVSSLAFSPDGHTLVSGGADSTIKIWHAGALDLIDILHKHNGTVRCVAFTPDGQILATGSDDRKIMFWDLMRREVSLTISLDDTAPHALAFSLNGQTLVTGCYRKIKVWRMLRLSGSKTFEPPQLLQSFTGHSHIVCSLAVSSDGKILVSGSRDRTVKIWQLETGKLMYTLNGHTDEVCVIALSPDGQIIASGSVDKTIKLWHLSTGELLDTFIGHVNTVTALAFTASGKILVSGSLDKTIKIWHKS